MPVEAKPLFRPDVLRSHLSGFQLPDHVASLRSKLDHWADLIASRRIDNFNEQEILPDFLTDFFVALLGYTRPADSQSRYTISRERHVEVDGKIADAVLGDFNGQQRPVVALEGKGPKDPLDRPFAGRHMSAVDQGYRYAINLPCDWIVVTSIRWTRLYHKGSDQQTYELFDTERLADDDASLRRFVFLLGADRVVPPTGACHFYGLLEESEKIGRELTKKFYVCYADMRQDAFEQLSRDNTTVPRHDVLSSTQKALDRVLFVAFAEDRGLLPTETIRKAYEHHDPYHPRPIWDNFRGLFTAINQGNAALGIHAYNGGLFADDAVLDSLKVSDEVCSYFLDLGSYDYRPPHEAVTGDGGSLIDVDILGHIFEQSITDLEKLRNELDGLAEPLGAEKHKTRRKKEGAFYTPSFITRYIIEQALGGVLRDRFEQLRQKHHAAAKAGARAALADPAIYELDKLTKPQRAALVEFWEVWQDELTTIRLLDPACGSGAFLIEAFDQLHATYELSNDRLAELRGHRTLFDLDKRILENNLYGVDLNKEAIEICRLSLWIKTAQRGKALTSLDHPIREGNSVVADATVHPKALDWQVAFPEVFQRGGFDVVVGNPPYVRQELLSGYKLYLQAEYKAYHGMADLYVYFYELGLRVLKPGGLLSFIVTNKWMKSGYGEPLRRLFSEEAWIESVIDFGHAKQIFPDADVFPGILITRKPDQQSSAPSSCRVCVIPRDQLKIEDLKQQIKEVGHSVPRARLGADIWSLEPPGTDALLDKLVENAVPLKEFLGGRPLFGLKTGLNEAFIIDTPMRNSLIRSDPASERIIRPCVRGQDLDRWRPDWAGFWMIAMKSSGDHPWLWASAGDQAEDVFRSTFPAIHAHLNPFRDALVRRQDRGRFWWELRACAYWDAFDKPKVFYQDITWQSQLCFDPGGTLCNNTVYFLPTADPWVMAVMNSPVGWWYAWRKAQHGKDEALRYFTEFVETFPTPTPTEAQRATAAAAVHRLIEIADQQHGMERDFIDWLRVEYEISKPSKKLLAPVRLNENELVDEVRKGRGRSKPLSPPLLRSLRDSHLQSVVPIGKIRDEAKKLESEVAAQVNAAFRLAPEDVRLIWETAPPRMPGNSA